ncbi:MAG: hypothetical protein KA369_07045 [Spirochaetes bacterium]|nr:hypothetical protein [Spirochaetota bacterium]
MKRIVVIHLLAIVAVFSACSKDYSKDIIGTWDAGKATLNKNMTVVIKNDGTMTAEIKDLDMKPIKGTYRLDGGHIEFKLSTITLSYRITSVDGKALVMRSKDARITWNRLE